MMHAKDINGTKMFHSDDFLTANQIGGFFSRLASKKTLPNKEAEIEVMEAARYETDINTMIFQVVENHLEKLKTLARVLVSSYQGCR